MSNLLGAQTMMASQQKSALHDLVGFWIALRMDPHRMCSAYADANDLVRRAREVVAELAEEVGETVHLAVLDGFEVLNVAGHQPRGSALQCSLREGERIPTHCTALGKVLIACADEERRASFDREVISSGGLRAFGPATILDPDKFREHCSSVANQGFATDLEEWTEGIACAAAPVHRESGALVAALSISVPSARADEDTLLAKLVPAVLRAAGALSSSLGAPVGD